MSKFRVYQIDLFRFIAALGVVLFHYLFLAYASDELTEIHFKPLADFFKYGYLGVNFFFIISGFVIALSISHGSIIKFIKSRIIRLYPIYWISVLMTFLIVIFFGKPIYEVTFKQLLANLTMLQSGLMIESIDGSYWTLFVELKFYVFIGVFLIIKTYFEKITLNHFIIFWLSLTIIHLFVKDIFIIKLAKHLLVLEWSSYFIAGMLFYQIFKTGFKLKYLMLIIISLAISLHYAIEDAIYITTVFCVDFSETTVTFYILMGYTLMFLVSMKKLKFINSPKLLKIGILTYPLYLIHQNIGILLLYHFGDLMNKYLLLFIILALMLFISYIMSSKLEPKLQSKLKTGLDNIENRFSKFRKKN